MIVEQMLETARDKLVTVASDAKLIEAAKLLSSGTDFVVVCGSNGALQGVITKTDVVKKMSVCQGATCLCPVSSVMIKNVLLCKSADLLKDVSALMKEWHLKNVPVVDDMNRPIGVLTARAVLRMLLGDAEYQEAQLVDYVGGAGYR